MPIYEKYIGRNRDSFSSLEELQREFKITYPETFNFAYDVMDELAETKPDKLAMLWLSNKKEEKRFTFKEVMQWSNKVANFLKKEGIKKGDKILLVLKRSYLFWFTMLALHKIGAVGVQATPMLCAKDYIYRCNAAGIKAVLITADGDCTDHFDQGADECKTVIKKFVTKHKQLDGWIDFEAGIEAQSDVWEKPTGDDYPMAKDEMFIAFSSGTTGYPKMIIHDQTYPLGHIVTGVFWHRVVDGGLHFTISDTGWMKSMWGKFYGQWFGESAHLIYDFDKFDGADILQVLHDYKVTTFCVPPTMYRFMLQNDVSKYDLSSLTHCCSAGEALNAEIFNTWKSATGLEIHEGFGQSETPVCLGTLYPFEKPISGTIGKPVPGFDVKLVKDNGEECSAGEIGEIVITATQEHRPCGLFSRYDKDDEANKRAWRNGFYHTGDTAYQDEHGRFIYVGRNDDVIKSSGYRIGPFEVESVLLEHPAVLEVAVTGIPDAIRGFNVKATIVLQKGYVGSPELIKELQMFVKTNTAPYKYPRVVEFVDSLPKTFSGKIKRVEIRQNDIEKSKENK